MVVLFQSQMWLYHKEEQRLRRRLNLLSNNKIKNKTRLQKASEQCSAQAKFLEQASASRTLCLLM